MQKSKTLSKGFTLVELIVVMAMFMVFISGVYIFLRPVADDYQKTEAYNAASGTIDNVYMNLNAKFRTALKMVVYRTNDKLADTDITLASGTDTVNTVQIEGNPYEFTNYVILDNVNNYSTVDDVSSRKHSRGRVLIGDSQLRDATATVYTLAEAYSASHEDSFLFADNAYSAYNYCYNVTAASYMLTIRTSVYYPQSINGAFPADIDLPGKLIGNFEENIALINMQNQKYTNGADSSISFLSDGSGAGLNGEYDYVYIFYVEAGA